MTVRRASKLLANNIARWVWTDRCHLWRSPMPDTYVHPQHTPPSRYLGKLSMGTMVLGHDPREGFSIFYVDHEGVRSQGRLFAVGSGSTHAYRWVGGFEGGRDGTCGHVIRD